MRMIAMLRRFCSMAPSPAVILIILLIPLMLLELAGIAAEGRKQYRTFEGAIMLMAATLAVVWNVIGGAINLLSPYLPHFGSTLTFPKAPNRTPGEV